jgi:hypothetical protein
MQQPAHFFRRAVFACGALAVVAAAHAQVSTDANVPPATARKQTLEIARGDPARWQQEDTTPAARLRTIRKEIAAGLQENLGVCKAGPATERAACVKEARATYQLEMAGAKARAAGGQ